MGLIIQQRRAQLLPLIQLQHEQPDKLVTRCHRCDDHVSPTVEFLPIAKTVLKMNDGKRKKGWFSLFLMSSPAL